MEYEKKGPSSYTGGVLPIPIEGRFKSERERLAGGFTDEDRAWRKQWLKDQELGHNDGVEPEWYYRERYNPIRRAYMLPLNTLFKKWDPTMSPKTQLIRTITGRALLVFGAIYTATYMVKYHRNDWTRPGGWRLSSTVPSVLPGEPNFPFDSAPKAGKEYYDNGFKNSVI